MWRRVETQRYSLQGGQADGRVGVEEGGDPDVGTAGRGRCGRG